MSSDDFKRVRKQILELLSPYDDVDQKSALIVLANEVLVDEGLRTWVEFEEMMRPVFEKFVRRLTKVVRN